MRHTQKIIFIIVLSIACFSAYSLAQLNQIHIINYEWNNNKIFTSETRQSVSQWTSGRYTDYMNFEVVTEPNQILTIDGESSIKRVNLPEIDFEKEFLIFATLGEVENKGYSININKIGQSGNIVEVMVDMANAGDNLHIPYSKAYPYDVIKVSKDELVFKGNILVIFKDNNGNEIERQEVNIKA